MNRAHFAERVAVPAWALALTALLLAPQRHRGFGLGHDMVFTPQQPLNAAAVGVSSAPPRAVPVDFVVAVLERVVDGAVLGRLALAVPLLLAGLGAARLLAGASLPARLAACGLAIWNPFVVERLALGQWSLVWGYAALPWVLAAALAWRRRRAGLGALVLPVALGSLTPTGGVLAVLLVAAVVLGRDIRRAVPPVLVALALQLPWIVASMLSTGATLSDPASATAFAARSEFAGVLPSVLGLGGIWDAEVVPPSRSGPLTLVALLVVIGAAVAGGPGLWRRLGAGARGLTVVAALGLLLAQASATPGAGAVVRWAVSDLPGGGLLRDAQKWLAPLALLEALLVGAALERLAGRAPAVARLLIALALPLALLPDATRAVWPTMTPATYPAGYATAAHLIDDDVVVLPFQPYRQFAWAGGRPSYDPASRLLDATVVGNDRLLVGSRLLTGEDARVPAVAAALASADPRRALADAGVRWVLIERRTPGAVPALPGLVRVHADADVVVYRVPGTIGTVDPPAARVAVAAVVDTGWLIVAVAAGLVSVRSRGRRRRRPEPADDLEGQPDR